MLLLRFAKQAQKPLDLSISAENMITTLFNNLKQSFQLGQSNSAFKLRPEFCLLFADCKITRKLGKRMVSVGQTKLTGKLV